MPVQPHRATTIRQLEDQKMTVDYKALIRKVFDEVWNKTDLSKETGGDNEHTKSTAH